MSFTRMLKHSCSISRTTTTTGIKKAYAPVSSGIACLIQPLDAEAAQNVGMAFGKAFKAFFDPTVDIRVGDRIVDHLGRTMSVKGLRLRDYGNHQHLEVMLEQDQAK